MTKKPPAPSFSVCTSKAHRRLSMIAPAASALKFPSKRNNHV